MNVNTFDTCSAAIRRGSWIELSQALPRETTTEFWSQVDEEGRTLLQRASTQASQFSQEVLVALHQAYAHYLQGLPAPEKAALQAEALFETAELCRVKDQSTFSQITSAYASDCPYEHYIQEESHEMMEEIYSTNQKLYAKWCYITSLAMRALWSERSLGKVLAFGARSRHLLAEVSRNPEAHCFGKIRDSTYTLITPLYDDKEEHYYPWYSLANQLYQDAKKSGDEYTVFAVDVDGTRVPGTKICEADFLFWRHTSGVALNRMKKVAQNWALKCLDEPSLENFGMFYHTLV